MSTYDIKQMEQIIKSIKAESENPNDKFKNVILKETLRQFENSVRTESKIDSFFIKKRIDISEKLCFNKKDIRTTMRVFVDSEVSDEPESEMLHFKLNLFGRLILNENSDKTEGEYFEHFKNENKFSRHLFRNFSFCENVNNMSIEFENQSISGSVFSAYQKNPKGGIKTDSINGFSLIRSVHKSKVEFPIRCYLKISFEGNEKSFELKPALAEFMKGQFAKRKEVVDKIFDYVKEKNLLFEEKIMVDAVLEKIIEVDDNSCLNICISVSELNSRIKNMFGEVEKYEIDYLIHRDAMLRKYLDVYDMKITVPLEAVSDIISFYVSKFVYNEEEKRRLMAYQQTHCLNTSMKNHEKTTQLQDQISKQLINLKTSIIRRNFLKKLSEDPTSFLENYIQEFQESHDLVSKLNQKYLGKRSSIEENEFTQLLFNKYEEVFEKEIEAYLKTKPL